MSIIRAHNLLFKDGLSPDGTLTPWSRVFISIPVGTIPGKFYPCGVTALNDMISQLLMIIDLA
jgi:hypothetical protein